MVVDTDTAVALWTAIGVLGVIALTIAAPYFAGFIADAVLIGVRRRRVRAIATSIPIALAVAVTGYWTWQVAITAPGNPAQVQNDLEMVSEVLMPIGIALGAIAFVVRQARSVVLIRSYRGRAARAERADTRVSTAPRRTLVADRA